MPAKPVPRMRDQSEQGLLPIRRTVRVLCETRGVGARIISSPRRSLESHSMTDPLSTALAEALEWAQDIVDAADGTIWRNSPKPLAQALLDQHAALTKAEAELAGANEALKDPVIVHASMLRGTIATPPLRNMLHVYGAETLAKWDRAEKAEADSAALTKANATQLAEAHAVIRKAHAWREGLAQSTNTPATCYDLEDEFWSELEEYTSRVDIAEGIAK